MIGVEHCPPSRWAAQFRATLADAYLGFLTIWLWIAHKERRPGARWIWFVLVMTLGNIAIAVYLLRLLFQADPANPIDRIVMRTPTG